MDIATAERALVGFVASRCGLTVDAGVFRGQLPPGTTGAAVRFVSGHGAGEDLAEFTAEVAAVFDEPGGALGFAGALWNGLPVCNVAGFARIAGTGEIALGFADGRYTVKGRLVAAFC